jgi:NDP-sugar pyrophosphorylase family protein
MEQKNYHPVSRETIAILERQLCSADNWEHIKVSPAFDPSRVHNVVFHGENSIGALSADITLPDTTRQKAELRNAVLRDVTIGDNCRIVNVRGCCTNCDIGDNVVIEDAGTIACVGESSFGNGQEVGVINEAGGRPVKITVATNSQAAYLTAQYRHDKKLIAALDKMADSFAAAQKSSRAVIGKGASIIHCNEILNVKIGDYAVVNGAGSLRDGTIDSSQEAPSRVGHGVIEEHFIFQKGSSVEDGAMVSSTLVGEGTRMGKQFSSENCVFFANSECFHSEACSVFAGPYSVSHHRSTLLIAGMISFYNAGSGTNQSNHMYKLGPVHQGILERGCKTGSFSYLLWPSRVGAFSNVIGKQHSNFDSSDLPFSLINEEGGKSTIFPGINFFASGVYRDGEKWPARDRRKSAKKLDFITFNVFSPYTGQKIIRGSQALNTLQENASRDQEYVSYKGISIKRLLLKTCKRYYDLAIDKYFAEILFSRTDRGPSGSLREILTYDKKGAEGDQEWLDIGGLLCPQSRLHDVVGKVASGSIATFDALYGAFKEIYDAYRADEWNWFLAQYRRLNNVELHD